MKQYMKTNTLSLKNRAGRYIKAKRNYEYRLINQILLIDLYMENANNGIKTRKSNGDVIQITIR